MLNILTLPCPAKPGHALPRQAGACHEYDLIKKNKGQLSPLFN